MRFRLPSITATFFLSILLPATAFSAVPGVYAITGGRVHRVSGPPLESATVIIRNGLIEQVGTNITPPIDATVIDAKGEHVYPGLIDALTSIGLPAAETRRPGGAETRPSEARLELSPSLVVARSLKLTDELLDGRRAIGVTTLLIAPTSGILNGQAAILNLSSDRPESRLLRSPAALVVAYNPRSSQTFPDSLMGVVAHLRQTFLDAKRYVSANDIYAKSPAGRERVEQNADLDALRPVMTRELPVIFVADSDLLMTRSLEIAREMNLRPILASARQSYAYVDQIVAAAVPVLVSVNFPKPSKDEKADADLPLRLLRERVLAPTSAAVLAQKKVQFGLVSNGAGADDFIDGVRLAIKAGLSPDAALRALTLAPAEILGIARQVGSIDPGKIANIIISAKPLFDDAVKPKMMFVDGRIVRLPKPEEKRADGAAATSAESSWSIVLQTPEGASNIRVTTRGESGSLTGTFSGDAGSGEIRDGSLNGDKLQFTITIQVPGSETSDWRFDGTISGSTLTGTATSNAGTFSFTGSRPQ